MPGEAQTGPQLATLTRSRTWAAQQATRTARIAPRRHHNVKPDPERVRETTTARAREREQAAKKTKRPRALALAE